MAPLPVTEQTKGISWRGGCFDGAMRASCKIVTTLGIAYPFVPTGFVQPNNGAPKQITTALTVFPRGGGASL
jgi:hypothetical protein